MVFKSGTTERYKEAIYGYKRSIHRAYIEHEYLIFSKNLLDGDKKACTMWCEEYSFKQMGFEDVMSGLARLARMLRKHFNKEVVALIDE